MCLANFGWGEEQSMVHVGLDVFSPWMGHMVILQSNRWQQNVDITTLINPRDQMEPGTNLVHSEEVVHNQEN
jgi:hypothetical protein